MSNVFISHRGADADEAEKLASAIAARGHKIWLDSWDIKVGDSIVEKINKGLAGMAYLVLCYSSSGVLAPWMSREWMAALSMELNGHSVRILPVRLTGGKPPAILDDINYADLVRDWDDELSRLLKAIR